MFKKTEIAKKREKKLTMNFRRQMSLSNILDMDMQEDPNNELEANIKIYHSYTIKFSFNSLYTLNSNMHSKTLNPYKRRKKRGKSKKPHLTLDLTKLRKEEEPHSLVIAKEDNPSPVQKSRIPRQINSNRGRFFRKMIRTGKDQSYEYESQSLSSFEEKDPESPDSPEIRRVMPRGKLLTRQFMSKHSIDFGLPDLDLETFVRILDFSEDEIDLVEELQMFSLKNNIRELKGKYGLTLCHIFSILSNYSDKISKYAISTLLDLQNKSPCDKDNNFCSAFLYSKIFQNVKITSILFDYLIYFKKQKALKSSKIWWMKMLKIRDFSLTLSWKIRHKYIPVYGSFEDDIKISKKGDKILVEIKKIKGKGLKFKESPTSFLFLPLSDKKCEETTMNNSYRNIQPILENEEETEIFKENTEDKGSLSSYRIICFDHARKRFAFVNGDFNLEEKKKIIEGYYDKSDRVVKDFKTSYQNLQEDVKGNRTKVRFKTCVKTEKIEVRVAKSGRKMPLMGSVDRFVKFLEGIFEIKIVKKSKSYKAEFEFSEDRSKRNVSTILLLLNLISFCNPVFSKFSQIFDFLKKQYYKKSINSFTVDLSYGFEIKVDVRENKITEEIEDKVARWAKTYKQVHRSQLNQFLKRPHNYYLLFKYLTKFG